MSRRKRCYRRFRPQLGIRTKRVTKARGWAIQVDLIPIDRWAELFPPRIDTDLLSARRDTLEYVRQGLNRSRIVNATSGDYLRTKVFLASEEDFVLLTLVGYKAIYRAYRLIEQP